VDQTALQSLVSNLNSTPLDFNRPLWQMHYVDQYQGGCALIVRIHHCIADGISLVRVLLSLTDECGPEDDAELCRRRRKRRTDTSAWPEWRRVIFRARRNLRLARRQVRQTWRTVQKDPAYLLRLGEECALGERTSSGSPSAPRSRPLP